MPRDTEEAQYALGFPVAALLVRGQLGGEEIMAEGLATMPSERWRPAFIWSKTKV